MSLDIESALRGGVDRLVAQSGLTFVAIFVVLGFLTSILSADITIGVMSRYADTVPPSPGPRLGLSIAAAGAGVLVLGLIQSVVTIAAIRTFVSGERERIPSEYFTRRILWVLVNMFVGGIIFSLVVMVGFVALVIPGIFLLVSLFFWNMYVAVEDENFVEGFKDSWALTKGNRISLFLLGVIVIVLSVIVSMILNFASVFAPQIVSIAISATVSGVIAVFATATAADTFVQLRSDPANSE
jgi:hypothetical protein